MGVNLKSLGGLKTATTRIPEKILSYIDLLARAADKIGLTYKALGEDIRIRNRSDVLRIATISFTMTVLTQDLKERGVNVERLWEQALKGGEG